MKPHILLRAARPVLMQALLATTLLATAPLATAGVVYTTTLNLAPASGAPDGITRVVYTWSANVASGFVNSGALTELTLELFAGTQRVYVDDIIDQGALQPMGGVQRAGTLFDFNFDTQLLQQMRNVDDAALYGASGTNYRIEDNVTLQFDSNVAFTKVVDGRFDGFSIGLLASQVTTTVPEPGSFALAGLALLAGGFARRRVASA